MVEYPVTRATRPGEVQPRRIEHRNGAGHLEPAYEAQLRIDVRDRLRTAPERAFVGRTSRAVSYAEQSGEEFVMAITGAGTVDEFSFDDAQSDERGGPFVLTHAGVEFAYETDESNPTEATREAFPTS